MNNPRPSCRRAAVPNPGTHRAGPRRLPAAVARLAVVLALGVGGVAQLRAAVPVTPQSAAAAAAVAAPVCDLASDVAAIPIAAGNILRLPLGVIEVVGAPLPGLSLSNGFSDLGAGLKAPFELVFAVVKLPLSAVNAATGVCAAPAAAVPVALGR